MFQQRSKKIVSPLLHSLVLVGGLLSVSGSYGGPNEKSSYPYHRDVDPVYMSYEEPRSSVAVNRERKLQQTGKITVYGNYLLISEPNQGVHFYDNSDKANPFSSVLLLC